MDIIEEIEALLTGAPSEHWIEPFSRAADTIERLTREVAEAQSRERASHIFHDGHEAQMAALRAEVERMRITASAAINDLTATQEWIRRHGEHDQKCNVLDLDDEGRNGECSCGFAEFAALGGGEAG